MNLAKIYTDSNGDEWPITRMVVKEPHWAANRIQEGEKAIDLLLAIKAWDIENYITHGFSLPTELRRRIQELTGFNSSDAG